MAVVCSIKTNVDRRAGLGFQFIGCIRFEPGVAQASKRADRVLIWVVSK